MTGMRNKLTIFFLLTIFNACHYPRYFSSPEDPIYLLAGYQDAIRLWTAHDEIHHNIIGLADAKALYRSWEVRQAYLQAYSQQAGISDELVQRAEDREVHGYNKYNEFYVGLYCYKDAWNTAAGANPIWRFTLFSSTGGPVQPVSIEKLEPAADDEWMYLSDLSRGRTLYRILFPREDDDGNTIIGRETKEFELSASSMFGNLYLKYRLGPVPEQLQ
jgi:hypothetical protein